jgi:hypothetical protein
MGEERSSAYDKAHDSIAWCEGDSVNSSGLHANTEIALVACQTLGLHDELADRIISLGTVGPGKVLDLCPQRGVLGFHEIAQYVSELIMQRWLAISSSKRAKQRI